MENLPQSYEVYRQLQLFALESVMVDKHKRLISDDQR